MGQYQPLLRWIILLDINIPLLKKKIEREGGITGKLEVTAIGGYLMERYVSVYPFAYTIYLQVGSTGKPNTVK